MGKHEVALIELGGSHDECLYSQVLFLKKAGLIIHIIIRRDHYQRMIPYPEVDHWKLVEKPRNWAAQWRLLLGVRLYLGRKGIRRIVLNTASGNLIRKFCMIPGRSMDLTGILHNVKKLWTSKTQKIISRKVRKYFVLSEYILDNLEKENFRNQRLHMDFFYPVYFPEQDLLPSDKVQEFRICIPGAVDFARRDYISLLEELLQADLPAHLRFILLGKTHTKDGRKLLSDIKNAGLQKYFTTFSEFVPHKEFQKILSGSDMILPLITPGSKDFGDYLKYKITGAYNLAFGYHLPMLLHESLDHLDIFRNTSIFYSGGKLVENIREVSGNVSVLEEKRRQIREYEHFGFENQMDRYMDLLTL